MIEDDEYNDNYLDLFITEGWKQFIEDNQFILESLDLKEAKNWDDHLIIKTEIEIRERISAFEGDIRDAINNQNIEEEEYDDV
jgi:hypothetical protein